MIGKRRTLSGLLLVPILCAGCLDYERETIVAVFPPGTQEIHCLLVYEGLHVMGGGKADLDRARADLGRIFEQGDAFHVIRAFPIALKSNEGDDEESRSFLEMLRKHLTIGKGAFFLDKNGKLCGYQTVTVRDRDRLTTVLNRVFDREMRNYAVRQRAEPDRPLRLDDDSLPLIEKAAEAGARWLTVEPGRVSYSVPMTAEGARRFKRMIFKTDETVVSWLCDNPLSFEHRRNRFTVALGAGDGEPIRYIDAQKGNFPTNPELLAHARKLKVPFRADITAEGLITGFTKTGVVEK
jgi:hypothetical protein